MAYFPFFKELRGQTGLVVGGGSVALRKIRKLLPYGPKLRVVARAFSEEIRAIPGLHLLEKPFEPEDLGNPAFVIAATGDRLTNRIIADLCKKRSIPVNVADDAAVSTFLFPALVRHGDLSIGICTGGGSPTAAIYFKEQIEEHLPDRFDEILEYLHAQRGAVLSGIPDAGRRKQLQRTLFLDCMDAGRPLTEEETKERFLAAKAENGEII